MNAVVFLSEPLDKMLSPIVMWQVSGHFVGIAPDNHAHSEMSLVQNPD